MPNLTFVIPYLFTWLKIKLINLNGTHQARSTLLFFFFLNCGVLPKIFLDRQNSHFNTSPKFFLFFLENFNLWRPLLMIIIYHQIKISISFWCRREMDPRSLIQPSKILSIELTRTHVSQLLT